MSKSRVIVIGAGAAGLMAAGQAAGSGAEVILLEKMNQPARKLRITGKGRCNLTNISPVQEIVSHFGSNGKFLRQALARFSNKDLIDFFHELGLPTVTERGGRVFPESGEANDVVRVLIDWTKKQGVTLSTGSHVEKLLIENGRATGVIVKSAKPDSISVNGLSDKKYTGDCVIIATGGKSYPATGSTGDGYKLAESAGHTLTDIRPALVPLITEGKTASLLEGLSLKNVTASAYINNKKTAQEFGDMLFTGTGISGPIILTLSGHCVDALRQKNKVMISIDLKPALEHNVLDQRLLKDIKDNPVKAVKNILKGLLPERLIQVCLDSTGISPDKTSSQINAEERKRLRVWLKDFRLEVTGYASFEEAIITAGGISTKEIDPRTFESRIIKGLYFAGEVLDIDADTGGYNLQAAFSTGWLAGKSAASCFENQ
jgi:predicted Rossmann fold flavoprotein